MFRIYYSDRVVNEDIPALPKKVREMIRKAIETRLANNPTHGKPLQYSLSGFRSLRVSTYRIIYKIEADDKIIRIVAIDHRKDVYN